MNGEIKPEYWLDAEFFHRLPFSSQLSIIAHQIPVFPGRGPGRLPDDYVFPPMTLEEIGQKIKPRPPN